MWWINKFGNVTGPYSDEQIRKGIRSNQFTKLNKISEDRQSWIRLDQSEFWRPSGSAPEEVDLPREGDRRKLGAIGRSESFEAAAEEVQKVEEAMPVVSAPPSWGWRKFSLGRIQIVIMATIFCVLIVGVTVFITVLVSGNLKNGTENLPVPPPQPPVDVQTNNLSATDKPKSTGTDFESIKRKVVLIHCKEGNGTGFLMELGGRKYLVTNEHVIRSGENPEAVLIDGTKIKLGALSIAKDRDLARYEVSDDLDCLELCESMPNNNDEVWVYGNSMGDDVVTTLRGFVTGVGSKVLKVNAEIVGGNSGSPIIGKDGTVLAVAAYLRNGDGGRDWTTKNTSFDDVRRFGVRFTNVEWAAIDQQKFHEECLKMSVVDTYWDFLVPYLIFQDVSDERLATLKLEHKDVDKRRFGDNDYGFHEMLMELSKSLAGQGKSWNKWKDLGRDRDALIKRLNEAIGDGSLTRENAEKALKEFDEKHVGSNWEKVKSRHRDFIAKRKEALVMLRSFLQDESWVDSMIKSGYGDGNRAGSVDWYLEGIRYFLDQNTQKLKDLNKILRSLEKGDDDDEE